MVGPDAAGKTILYNLNLGEIVTTIPITVFNVETVEYNNCQRHGVGRGQPGQDQAFVALLLPEHTVSSLWLSAMSENM